MKHDGEDSEPTLVNSFKARRANAVVRLQVQPHLIAHAHDEIRNAGPRESARGESWKPLVKTTNSSSVTLKWTTLPYGTHSSLDCSYWNITNHWHFTVSVLTHHSAFLPCVLKTNIVPCPWNGTEQLPKCRTYSTKTGTVLSKGKEMGPLAVPDWQVLTAAVWVYSTQHWRESTPQMRNCAISIDASAGIILHVNHNISFKHILEVIRHSENIEKKNKLHSWNGFSNTDWTSPLHINVQVRPSGTLNGAFTAH